MVAKRRTLSRFGSLPLAMVACFLLIAPAHVVAQSNNSQPILILESVNTIYGIGGKQVELFVRLKQDGTVEWDEPVWQKQGGWTYSRKAASIPPEQLTAIGKRLAVLNKDSFRIKMGPYNTYTDTSVELQMRILTSAGSVAFLVVNPWPCELPSCSMGKSKPIPEDVKAAVCEANKLRVQLAGGPVDPMCKPQ
jgi:hypothetical protein